MKRFDLERLVRLPAFLGAVVAKDGRRVALYADLTGRMELFVLDTQTKALAQVSHGEPERSPSAMAAWRYGGEGLVFPRDRGGDEQHQLESLPLGGGRTEPLTEGRGQNVPGPASPVRDELLVMSNRDDQVNVYVLGVPSRRLTRLTHFAQPAYAAGWSPDGEWVYLTANGSDDPRNADLYRVRRDGADLERLYSAAAVSHDSAADVSRDGRLVAFTTDASGKSQPGVFDLERREARMLGDGTGDEAAYAFSPDGARLLTVLSRGVRSLAVEIDLSTGARKEVSSPEAVVTSADYLGDGRVLLTQQDTTHRPSLIAVRPDGGQAETLLEAEYGDLSPDDFCEGRPVTFPSDDLSVEGILYTPPAPAGARLPAIVWVHGGPTGHDLLSFNPSVQCLAARGFAVLQVNYRGSTGYGRAFREMNLGDIGGGDARDVAAGGRFLREQPGIDPDRIVCAGGSYGGYMTYRQLTHFPDLWAGGVALVGITDWALLYAESMAHFKHYLQLLFGGSPDEVPDRYRAGSPIHEADRMRAPLMILSGLNDPRCPISQARTFRDRLVALGKREGEDFTYLEASDQGHLLADQEQRLAVMRRMEAFLERFADPEAAEESA